MSALERLRVEAKIKKISLDAHKDSSEKIEPFEFEIEFLEIHYKYLDVISNNYLKKARRKLSKMPKSKFKLVLGDEQSF